MATGEGQRRRPALIVLLAVLAAAVLVADQVSKQIMLNTLTAGEYRPLIGDYFGLSLVFNPGAAFSLGEGSTWLFTIAMAVVTVVILVVARRLGSRGWAVALGALLGGTLGNLGDRLFREPGFAVGHVVDFLNYNGWFVGNIADIAIVLSAAGIAVLTFTGIGVNGHRATATEHDDGASEGKHVASGEDAEENDEQPAGEREESVDETRDGEDAAGEEVTRTDG
ncbi:signal peptidase II [Ruania zhangjianzhongii]|uniref:signal peptidase II n=1 Tax=Ruania zhangjianzhongii TaxID=2603206 RepID=UPI0011C9E015|nr:signal peptidase II [Ruania zhangjianzhongii]